MSKLSYSSSSDFKFGILRENELMFVLTKKHEQRTGFVGDILKIDHVLGDDKIGVRFAKDMDSWDASEFCCPTKSVIEISKKIRPFLYSVPSPQERVKLAKNRDKCDSIMGLTVDMTVGYSDVQDITLGVIKYIGLVRGCGYCFGIQLHEKKSGSKNNGSCGGTEYFNCKPGFGVFATIEKIAPIYTPLTNRNNTEQKRKTDLDLCIEKNVTSLIHKDWNNMPPHEEIVTKYGEYPKQTTFWDTVPVSNSLRNSVSLQNIDIDSSSSTINTNNEFDQNTILQPDRTHLMNNEGGGKKDNKNKSELDLIDGIVEKFNNFKKPFDKNDNFKTNATITTTPYENGFATTTTISSKTNGTRNKSMNPITHLLESGSLNKKNGDKIRNKTFEPSFKKFNEKCSSSTLQKPSTSTNVVSKYCKPPPGTTNDFTVGTLVEVSNDISETPLYGVVRWIGADKTTNFVLVGVELDEEQSHLPLTLTDGTHNGERLFSCSENRAFFVPLEQCHNDSRFQDGTPTPVHQVVPQVFEAIECPGIEGALAPLCMPTEEDVEAVCGKFRGIQGHHNSCYLDVTLFSMFTYTAVFDSLLFRPKGPTDITDYEQVQRVLREEIVNPLRKNLYVNANNVMSLRKLLDRLSSVSGLTSEEKDPEEFLNSLLAQILKAEPFLKLSSGQEAFYYQLFVEKNADLNLPTVQQLFEQSFLTSNIKLKEVPSCLIIQMPRFGKTYKMYPRIMPSQLLDVTDVIEGSPRQCTVCGKLARWECRDCFDFCNDGGLECTAFCETCVKTAHKHDMRQSHRPSVLDVSHEYIEMSEHCRPTRLYMELFAVICIETSHYVAFVKCGVGHEAPWCFFDSMADRKGEKHGYNIPEMVACPDISRWLSDDQICRILHDENPLDRHLPEHARRLLCDAYICMYQSSDVMMYR